MSMRLVWWLAGWLLCCDVIPSLSVLSKAPKSLNASRAASQSVHDKNNHHIESKKTRGRKNCACLPLFWCIYCICRSAFRPFIQLFLFPPPFCSIKRTNISFFSLILHFVFLKPGFLLPLISQVWEKIKSNPEEIKRWLWMWSCVEKWSCGFVFFVGRSGSCAGQLPVVLQLSSALQEESHRKWGKRGKRRKKMVEEEAVE